MEWFKTYFEKVRSLLRDKNEFSLEGKIFNDFCLISIIAAILSFFINTTIGLTIPGFISLGVFFAQCILYCISKIKGKLNLAIIISAIEVNILLFINYFFNSGISGPSLVLFTIVLLYIISVSNKKRAFLGFITHIIIIATLLIIEYFNEGLVVGNYKIRGDYFFDMFFSYLITIAVIYVGVMFLKTSYLEQKKSVTQKAQALEKLNAEKDKLFSVISHDLRTPLANVQQYLEMLAVVNLTVEERDTIEKELLNLTRNSQELLTNLLEWSRNQMEGVQVNQQSFILSTEISKTISHMNLLATKKKLELVVNIEENCTVFADIDMLNLLIRNLLHNAVKFAPIGGTIEICAKNTENECVIYVRDSGAGIPLEQQKDLFTLKAKTTFGTNKEKGTGIGLMLCKEYAEMQKGKIWFESAEDIGTTFYLSFQNEKAIRNIV